MDNILEEALKNRAYHLGKNIGELTPNQIAEVKANPQAFIPAPEPEVIPEVTIGVVEPEAPEIEATKIELKIEPEPAPTLKAIHRKSPGRRIR